MRYWSSRRKGRCRDRVTRRKIRSRFALTKSREKEKNSQANRNSTESKFDGIEIGIDETNYYLYDALVSRCSSTLLFIRAPADSDFTPPVVASSLLFRCWCLVRPIRPFYFVPLRAWNVNTHTLKFSFIIIFTWWIFSFFFFSIFCDSVLKANC